MPTLDFKGKQFIYGHHLTVPIRALEMDAEKSLTGEEQPSLDDNLIIHGNNLDALKALLPQIRGAESSVSILIPPITPVKKSGFTTITSIVLRQKHGLRKIALLMLRIWSVTISGYL